MIEYSTAPYTLAQHYSISLGEEQIELVTKPGLPSWNHVAPSSELFIENAHLRSTDRILLYGCHLGALAVRLAHVFPQLELYIADYNYTALEMSRMTLETNHFTSPRILWGVELPDDLHQKLTCVYIQLPKGRLLARRWLVQAYHSLKPDGSLYLAGANDLGIQSVIKDAQDLFGNSWVLAYRKRNRIAQYVKKSRDNPLPDWAQSPGITPGTWFEFSIPLENHTFQIRSLPGVFSYDRLDEGTRLLLSTISPSPNASVLDVGCGYGIAGLVAAKTNAGVVHMVDNNLLAIASSIKTAALNAGANVQVYSGDLLAPVSQNKYDLILSNPPFHTGQAVNYQIAEAMIGQSYQGLLPCGRLTIVANRFIRYDRLIKTIFGNVSFLAESGKFHVLSGLKS